MILTFGGEFCYVWGLVFLPSEVTDSYDLGLEFLQLAVSDSTFGG